MTFWSGDTLEAKLGTKKIVQPFQKSQIDCAAYTLLLGNEVYITPHAGTADPQTTTKIKLGEKEPIAIPSGQFAYLLTHEEIHLPTDVLGFISMKASVKFKGLINVSGFHIDPNYEGRLIFSVFNAGPSSIQIQQGDPLFLMWIADLKEPSTKFKEKSGYNEIPASLVQDIPGEILSLHSISSQIKQQNEKIQEIKEDIGLKLAEQKPTIDFLNIVVRSIIIAGIVGLLWSVLSVANPAINRVNNYLFGSEEMPQKEQAEQIHKDTKKQ